MRFSAFYLLAVLFTSASWAQAPNSNVKGVASKQVDGAPQEWQPTSYRSEIGYEAPTTGPLAHSTISYTVWWSQIFGADFLFGYSKSNDASTTNEVVNITDTTSSTSASSDVITNSGTISPSYLTLAVRPKYKIFMNNWLQVYAGFLLGFTKIGDVTYPTGTQSVTFPNRSDLSTYSFSQVNYGSTVQTISMQTFYGPTVGTEFYLKWIPHLALGFSTGILMGSGGDTTQTQTVANQAYTVSSGVKSTPTGSSTTTTNTTKIGSSSNTFGAGGTLFSLFNTAFTLRYVW